MKNGKLNKAQFARIVRMHKELAAMIAEIPHNPTPAESCTADLLIGTRNKLGELLRWQDFETSWKAATAAA